MWTFLIDILFWSFLVKRKKKTAAVVLIVITGVVFALLVVTFINKADYVN